MTAANKGIVYAVPIKRVVFDVYEVVAKSGTEAGMKVGQLIAEGVAPTRSSTASTAILAAKRLLDDTPAETVQSDPDAVDPNDDDLLPDPV